MARSLSVKVPTVAVIAQIEEAIKKIEADVDAYPADFAKYEVALEAYKSDVVEAAIKFVSNNASKIGYDYDNEIRINIGHSGKFELSFDPDKIGGFPKKPEQPKKPNQTEWYGNKHINRKEVLEQNLRILRMTSQEEINASSYSAVIDLI